MARPCRVGKWVALRGEGPPDCGGRTALDKEGKEVFLHSMMKPVYWHDLTKEGRPPSQGGPHTPVLEARLLADPAPTLEVTANPLKR